MSTRAETLATQFEQANAAAITAVEGCSEAALHTTTRDEGWPVAFAARHIGSSHASIMGLITLVANGQPLPAVTPAMLNAGNAAAIAEHAGCSKQEALEALRQNGTATAAAIRQLSDEQLDRSAVVELVSTEPLSAQQFIELALIGHATHHLASIEASTQAVA